MKKIYLSSFLIVALGLVGWQLGHHLLPTARAASSPSCTNMNTNIDPKQYNPDKVDKILYDYFGLITRGAFVTAVQNGALPFQSQAAAQTSIDSAISQIIEEVCGGKCNSQALQIVPQCVTESPVNVARQAYEQRLSNMNDCQKQVFQAMQANNEQYLAKVKKNNQQYYSAMAPITAQFRRNYFATNDSKTKGQLLQNYIQQNQVKRQELYNSQAKGLSDFLQQSIKLNQEFAACAKK